MKKIIKQKNSHIWMEKQFSHMFLGFIVVIFNFLKVLGGGRGGGLTNHRIFYLCSKYDVQFIKQALVGL